MTRRLWLILGVVVVAAAMAAGAAGFAAGRVVNIPRGSRADFTVGGALWSCFNAGLRVSCGSGDAFPFVDFSQSARGVTIVVHTLKIPQQGRISHAVDGDGDGVYTFTARP